MTVSLFRHILPRSFLARTWHGFDVLPGVGNLVFLQWQVSGGSVPGPKTSQRWRQELLNTLFFRGLNGHVANTRI